MENTPFVLERTFHATAEQIWSAITSKEKMKRWYFDLPEFKPEVGFEFRFEGGPPGRSYIHVCRITEVIPNRKLKHTWTYEGYPGISYVTWELFPEGNSTKVRLTHEGLETFPTDITDFARHNFETGWNHILGVSLEKFLE